ncbi:MAG: M28 family peptidase [Acidobacteria bacterium]|nr:M28 family peptidase [Acidobacteriota bacterium]
MDARQRRNVRAVLACIPALWILSPLAGFRQEPPPLSSGPLSFDAARAHRMIREFVTQYPKRVFGSFESRHSTGYLQEKLESLGYELEYAQFNGRIAGRQKVGRNVLGYKSGDSDEIIALVAHYDTASTTVQGSMKNGSGVGVLLEIARILASEPADRSILIVFSDGGEWGMLGAADLAAGYAVRGRIAAVLTLDGVAVGDLASLSLEETGLLRGFTPPWYRMLARSAAAQQGLPVLSASGFEEHIARTFYMPRSDQGPFLNSGIAAVNLGSRSADRNRERAVFHSPMDTIDNLETAGIEKFGLAAERIVRSLDALPAIPQESMDSFRLWRELYLGPKTVLALHGLIILPPLLCLFYCLRNHRRRLNPAAIARELLAFTATYIPFLFIYFLIGLFRVLRKLPVYPLYPATAKDPVLCSPSWGPVAGIAGIAAVVAGLCILFYMYPLRDHPKPDFNVSKPVLICVMLIAAVLALFHNSYWAVSFLTLPCWIWGLTGPGDGWNKRLRHWAWIAAAGIPYFIVPWFLAARNGIDTSLVWYQVLALNTGLFSAAGYFLAAATAALGIRFLTIQLHQTG